MKQLNLLLIFLCLFSASVHTTAQSGKVFTVTSSLPNTQGVALDNNGNLYVASWGNQRIYKVNVNTGVATVFAGDGTSGFSGDGGAAVNARFNTPYGLFIDAANNVYVADRGNSRVRKISTNGIITTIAGNGNLGFSGDGGLATNAAVSPWSIYGDPQGHLYIADNSRIRKIDATTGVINTIAGNGTTAYSGDGGLAINASIGGPLGIVSDVAGNIYFSDQVNHVIRKISANTGIISTVAGNGIAAYTGDNGPAVNAQLNTPVGVCMDMMGNIFIADRGNECIRRIDGISGIITRVAGTGIVGVGSTLDDVNALTARVDPQFLCLDENGTIYYSNYSTKVRKVLGNFTYSSNDFSVYVHNACNSQPHFQAIIPVYSSAYSLKTYYGDGTFTTTAFSQGSGGGYAHVSTPYTLAGTYAVKHVLYSGANAIDSISHDLKYAACNIVFIKLYHDFMPDCNYDAQTDIERIHPTTVEVDSNGIAVDTISAINGIYYQILGGLGDIFAFKVIETPPGTAPTCPVSGIVYDTITISGYTHTERFVGFNCINSTNFDLQVQAAVNAGTNRSASFIDISNSFCTLQNATLTMTFSPKYNFWESNLPPTSQTANTLTWNFNNLSTQTLLAPLVVKLDSNGQLLTVGDTVHTTFTLTPLVGDFNTSNNTVVVVDTITGPYDPNAIYVRPGSCVTPGTNLEYTVTFENLGNDTAHNVYIMDTLNNGFDMKSMRIVTASHTMNVMKITSGGYNILKFEFPDIDLPDSTSPARHGFVQYTIDTKNNYPIGSSVSNKAGIYFDYMPVVLTNVSQTVMCWPASVTAISHQHSIAVYPNPASETLTIGSHGQNSSFTITNNIGQVLKEGVLKKNKEVVDIHTLTPGIYYITIKGDGIRETRKFVKQ